MNSYKKNLRKLSALVAIGFFGFTSTAYGFCTWGIVPPGRVFEPLDATEVLVTYEDGTQTVVIRPEFRGNAEDFAIVYPTPSKPEIDEASDTIFAELNDATNPFTWKPALFEDDVFAVTETAVKSEGVTVVEQKDVGDYEATVLSATDATDLVEWLEENEYNFSQEDEEKMEYYVNQPGFHFIALKVNMDEFGSGEDVFFFGELSVLEFTFSTDKPQLPMRTLKSEMPMMTFDLYTIGSEAWYVPSVDTIYADIVDEEFLSMVPSIGEYSPEGKWIVRQEVKFEPKNSNQDIFLSSKETFRTVDANNQKRFSPGQLDADTGILPGSRGIITPLDTISAFSRNLTIGSRGEDVRALQMLLNDYGFSVSKTGPGSQGSETTYFGNRTKQALVLFQNFYRSDILTPIGLTTGTGYFGPSTRDFLK